MKSFICAVVMLLSFVGICSAGDFEVEVNKFSFMNEDYSSLSQQIPQLKLKYNWDNGVYVFAAGEKDQLSMVGQKAYDIYLLGAGVGYTHSITDRLAFFGDIGYYYPIYDAYGSHYEGQRYYMNAKVVGNAEGDGARFWEEYSVDEVYGDFGAVLGLKYTYKKFSAQLGYRYLNVDVLYLGESPSTGNVKGSETGWWQLYETQSYSGGFIGFTWRF